MNGRQRADRVIAESGECSSQPQIQSKLINSSQIKKCDR